MADQIIKSARSFSEERHARDMRVRDLVRERDAARINEAVLTIVSDGAQKMSDLRKSSGGSREEISSLEEVVDWGTRTFGSYVGKLNAKLLEKN